MDKSFYVLSVGKSVYPLIKCCILHNPKAFDPTKYFIKEHSVKLNISYTDLIKLQ